MSNPILLETERLTLREFTPTDVDDLHRQLSDPEVMRYYPAAMTMAQSEKWLQGILNDYQSNGFGMLAVHSKETGDYVGQVGVMRRVIDGFVHHYLSYLICKRFWGQGYAIEAVRALVDYRFATLEIDKIEALIDPENARSLHLAEKLGMQLESTVDHMGREHRVYALTR